MARADGRVRPGQKIVTAFSARAWNRAMDAADLVLGDRGGIAQGQPPVKNRPYSIVTVRNQSGDLVPRFGVLSISNVAINPNTSDATENTFAEEPVLVGVKPNVIVYGDKFVVCLEPIANDKCGRAIVSGMFACKVRINQTSHNYATAKLNDTAQLQSSTCGPVLLLWKDLDGWSTNDRDDRWAVGVM